MRSVRFVSFVLLAASVGCGGSTEEAAPVEDTGADSSPAMDSNADSGSVVDSTVDSAVPDAAEDTTSADTLSDTATADAPEAAVDGGVDAMPDVTDSAAADAADSAAADAADSAVADAAPDSTSDAFDAAGDTAVDAADSAMDAGGDAATVIAMATVATDSMATDKVQSGDGPIAPGGGKDGSFNVLVNGPVSAIYLITTDVGGTPTGGQQWDTVVGTTPIPAAIGTGFTVGGATWQLGVFEGGTLVNKADGSLPLLDGNHTLVIYAENSGFFSAGNHFRVIVQRPDDTVVRSSVITY